MAETPIDEIKLYVTRALGRYANRLIGCAATTMSDFDVTGHMLTAGVAVRNAGGAAMVVHAVATPFFSAPQETGLPRHHFRLACDATDYRPFGGRRRNVGEVQILRHTSAVN